MYRSWEINNLSSVALVNGESKKCSALVNDS